MHYLLQNFKLICLKKTFCQTNLFDNLSQNFKLICLKKTLCQTNLFDEPLQDLQTNLFEANPFKHNE